MAITWDVVADKALTALLGAAVPISLWVASYYKSRPKNQHISCRLIGRYSVATVAPEARDTTTIFHNGIPIENLDVIGIEMTNVGSSSISNPKIGIIFSENTVILTAKLVIEPEQSEGYESNIEVQNNKVLISLSYLNPQKEHNQLARVSLSCEGELQPIKFTGGGDGWSVAEFDESKDMVASTIKNAYTPIIIYCLLSGAIFAFAVNIISNLRTSTSQFQAMELRALVAIEVRNNLDRVEKLQLEAKRESEMK